MLDSLISLIAPHSCLACSRPGPLLCDGCVSELIEARAELCIGCGAISPEGLCSRCRPGWPVDRALLFGERTGVLKRLIDEYKFSHCRSAYRELARLAGSLLPYASGAVIVPVPTIGRHIRERGYDHMALIAQHSARYMRLRYAPVLARRGNSVQHGASRGDRLRQAETAFTVTDSLSPDVVYIVIDDITTTGASLKSAARVLRTAGARQVWAVALARQPLDDQW